MDTPPHPFKLPKVAIILPVFNVEDYLQECLHSILAQSYPNFVVYAIDDGSTDWSGAILDAQTDQRIKVSHQKNQGVSAARNLGLDLAQEDADIDYICFLDSDDYVAADYLKCFVEALSEADADYGVCSYQAFNKLGKYTIKRKVTQKKRLTQDEIIAQFFHISLVSGHGVKPDSTTSKFLSNRFFKYSLIKHLRFKRDLTACEDQEFLIRAIPLLHCGVVIPDVLFFYRRRISSLSNKGDCVKQADLAVYKSFYKNRTQYIRSIRIGIQTELLFYFFQNFFSFLASQAQPSEKKARYLQALQFISQEFEFPFNRSVQKKVDLLNRGFDITLIWAKGRHALKRFRNWGRSMKFFR